MCCEIEDALKLTSALFSSSQIGALTHRRKSPASSHLEHVLYEARTGVGAIKMVAPGHLETLPRCCPPQAGLGLDGQTAT